MNCRTEKSPRPNQGADSKAPFLSRFENPIVKVDIRSGIICNRLEKYWTEQSIKIKECAS